MNIPKIWYVLLSAAWIVIWWIELLSEDVREQRETIWVSVNEILEKKEKLDSMYEQWICETSSFEKNNTDWVVTVFWYKCKQDINWENIEKDYIITLSNINKEYIWNMSEKCKDRKINYWALWDRSPILSSRQSVITIRWEKKVIDDVSCKTILKTIET